MRNRNRFSVIRMRNSSVEAFAMRGPSDLHTTNIRRMNLYRPWRRIRESPHVLNLRSESSSFALSIPQVTSREHVESQPVLFDDRYRGGGGSVANGT